MRRGNIIVAGVSLLALATPARAQDAGNADGSADIVVTAERTNRTLQQTAASVSVATQDDVDNMGGAYSTDDVIGRIPNLVSTRPAAAPAIRGIDGTGPASGGDAFFGGTRPRVNFQVDNRTLTFNEAIYLDGLLWDIQQIEVYRGPQSTLQGRNAIGGVVAIKTADPTWEWTGKARAVIGESDIRQYSGALGGPLVDDVLAFRVAADWRTEQAFVDGFTPFAARNSGLSTELKNIDNPGRYRSLTLRGKLLFTPSPDVRALLTVTHSDAYGPQDLTVLRPLQDHISSYPPMPRFRTRANTIIADTDFRISDGLSFSFLGTVTDYRVERFAVLGDGNALIDGREYTAEPRLRFGSSEDRLSGFVAGLIYRARQDEEIDLFDGIFKDRTDTNAVFGELSWKASEVVGITLGARYEAEKRDRSGGAGPFVVDLDRTFKAFLPRATLTIKASDTVTMGATVGRGYNAGGAGFSYEFPFPSYVYDKETVTNYEGFVRASLAGGRLDLRGNIFFNDYSGLQLPFDINDDPALFSFVIRNAKRATTYGAEIETRYRALDALTVFVNAGLLKTKVNRYDDPAIQGNELPRAPAFTLNAGFLLKPVPALELSFDIRYTDAYYSDAFNDARGKTDPYTLANAQIAWNAGPARVFVAASNLFDTTDAIRISPGATRAQDTATISRPRRVTGGVEVKF